jgi:hypothetical protein
MAGTSPAMTKKENPSPAARCAHGTLSHKGEGTSAGSAA